MTDFLWCEVVAIQHAAIQTVARAAVIDTGSETAPFKFGDPTFPATIQRKRDSGLALQSIGERQAAAVRIAGFCTIAPGV